MMIRSIDYILLLCSLAVSAVGQSGPPHKSAADRADQAIADARDIRYANRILILLGALVAALAVYRLVIYCVCYVRTLACINNPTQKYFRTPTPAFARIKEHFIYAPLFRKRHHEEFSLFGATLGILPSRFQTLFLIAVVGTNVALCVCHIPWDGPQQAMLQQLRNRTGVLAVVNMIPMMIVAGRNNPLIIALNTPFEACILVHRLFGRIVAAEAFVHTVSQLVIMVNKGGWDAVIKGFQHTPLITSGVVTTLGLVVLIFQSSSIFRRAFYETFLHMHISLSLLTVVALWYHIPSAYSKRCLIIVIVIWALERTVRLTSLLYRNIGRGGTRAVAEAMPGNAIRVNIEVARPWNFRPGQHIFLTIPSIGLWTSHPFSVAWSDEGGQDSEKGLTLDQMDLPSYHGTSFSFVVRRRAGFTNSFYQKAEKSPNGRISLRAFVEGPYGGSTGLESYGTVMLFANGVGITHQVPFVRDLIAGFANGTVALRRLCLVWVIQSPEHLEWIRPWMTTILSMEKRREILRIQLFVTRPRSTKEIHSPSATVQMFPGKPNVDTLVQMECAHRIGAMAVSVCGTGGFNDDVRMAVRKRQGEANIDFLEENFSW